MAEDRNQQPFRSSETPRVRAPGNDPLAELARLIGQTDPFGEFSREPQRPAAPQPPSPVQAQPQPQPSWPPAPTPNLEPQFTDAPSTAPASPGYFEAPPSLPPVSQNFEPPAFIRQPFGSAPIGGGNDLYHAEPPALPFRDAPAAPAFDEDRFRQEAAHGDSAADAYDDVPPPRRRVGILAIAAVFALAVVGTAGALGYRAVFGTSGSSGPPPVIKADTAPSKVVPQSAAKDTASGKQITDRVGERLVSREEKPIDIKDKVVSNTPFPPPATSAPATAGNAPNSIPAILGSGAVGDPKRVRTIAIQPDSSSAPVQASAPAPAPAPSVPVQMVQPRPAPPPAVSIDPENPPPPAPRQTAARPAPAPAPAAVTPSPPPQPRQAAAPSNAPLSLNPNAPAPARQAAPAPAPAPARTASVAPTPLSPSAAAPATAASGQYAVQVSSQRSEEEAQAAFRALQAKYPGQLGNRAPLIRRVDLGEKGVYYRALVGPFASGADASSLCSSLKSAGGSCLIQKN